MTKRQFPLSFHALPPLVFLALTGTFFGIGGVWTFEPPLLLPILNSTLGAALPLLIAVLALRSYVLRGVRVFVLLGCGMIAYALGSFFAALGLASYGANFAVTVHNTAALLGGLFNFAAVGMLFLGSASRAVPSRRQALLSGGLAYAGTMLFILIVVVLCRRGVTPVFFTEDAGPTFLRQAVITVAAICCVTGAVMLVSLHARTGMALFSLYSNALFLTAIGLAALLAQKHTGGLLGWTGRASQYTGSVYFVLALVVGYRETRAQGTSLPAYLSELFRSRLDQEVQDRTTELLDLNRRLRVEVGERRRAEESLRLSEERLRLAAEATGFGIYFLDHETGRTYWSRELLALFGLPPGTDFPLHPDWVPMGVHPDDLAEFRSHASAARDPTGTGILDAEFRILRPDGEVRWLRARSRTIFNGTGRSAAVFRTSGIAQDITERKLAEAKLRESEEVYRSILESSLQGIAIIQDGRFVLCNDALSRMSGYTREEACRMTPEEVRATIHPVDIPRAVEGMQAILESGQVRSAEVFRLINKSGKVNWVEVLGTRTVYRGRPALQLSYVDVTGRKHAEEAYRALVENAPEGYAIVQSGRIVFANAELAALTGFTVDALLEMRLEQFTAQVHADDQQRVVRSMEEDQEGLDWPSIQKFRYLHRDGSERVVETQSVLIELDGAPAIQVLYKDVTEADAAQDALNETHRKMRNLASHLLRAREEERRKVAQEVHDELGQILAALKMDLHWLKKRVQGTSEAVDRKIRAMIDLGDQTIGVVQRISSELRPKMLDDLGLAPALDWLAADFRRRVRVPCSVSVDVPSGMIGGSTATILYRVAQEALSNVGRHSLARHAGVNLRVSDGSIELRVEDDGIGITPAQRAAADSFGLIGMHERIEGLGGTVSVTGEPGRGTTVIARIPLPAEGGLA